MRSNKSIVIGFQLSRHFDPISLLFFLLLFIFCLVHLSLVVAEEGGGGPSVRAILAEKRFFPCVGSLVLLQLIWTFQLLPTNVTRVLSFLMREEMYF